MSRARDIADNGYTVAGGSGVSVPGTYVDLYVVRNTTNGINITAEKLLLTNADDETVALTSVDVTIAGATTGANGLDTGSRSSSTWYHLYVIWNGTTAASLMSLSSTSPTLPSGYTYFARVGAARSDSTSDFKSFVQINNYAWWRENMAIHTSGAAMSWSARTITSFYPPTAKKIYATFTDSRECGLSAQSDGRGGSYSAFGASGGNTSFNALFASSTKICTLWCPYASSIYYWQQSTGDDLDAIAWEY